MLTKGDLEQVDKLMEKRTAPIEKLQNSQGKEFRKKLDLVISFFDRDINRLIKQVDRLERHTGLPPFE